MAEPTDDEITRLRAEADQRQMAEREAIEEATRKAQEATKKALEDK